MPKQIDVTTAKRPVRDFLQSLRPVREPVELVVEGEVFARIIPPQELSDSEKEAIILKGWQFVQKARARNKGVPTKQLEKEVEQAVKQVRER
jgi:antitoxin (DNA-binding transcriptional repressor) of toxin-antitoxin stability system